jgi:hypothetical protein
MVAISVQPNGALCVDGWGDVEDELVAKSRLLTDLRAAPGDAYVPISQEEFCMWLTASHGGAAVFSGLTVADLETTAQV